ncbi:glycosyltransferase family 4 protein [Planctomycetota bacterium]
MSNRNSNIRLLYIVTSPITLRSKLVDQIEFMACRGFDVSVIVGLATESDFFDSSEIANVYQIDIRREISVLRDLAALIHCMVLVWRIDPQIVNASTPKAGLIGMMAAWLNRVPIRVHTLRGLRHETLAGPKALVVKTMERITSFCATRVLSVSQSLQDVYVEAGLCPSSKVVVLGPGSSNGVDSERFDPGIRRSMLNAKVRFELGIPQDSPVVGFLGRFTKDKGFEELSAAIERVQETIPECHLLLIGEFEPGDPVPMACRKKLEANKHVHFVPFVQDPSEYFAVIDVLAFPSYREGMPVVPLEAAAAGVPTVAFAATGSVDAVKDGLTGTIVPMHDIARLTDALTNYLQNEDLRMRHGRNAKAWVRKSFKPETVWRGIADEYAQLLNEKGLEPPTPPNL